MCEVWSIYIQNILKKLLTKIVIVVLKLGCLWTQNFRVILFYAEVLFKNYKDIFAIAIVATATPSSGSCLQ